MVLYAFFLSFLPGWGSFSWTKALLELNVELFALKHTFSSNWFLDNVDHWVLFMVITEITCQPMRLCLQKWDSLLTWIKLKFNSQKFLL